MAVNAHKVRGPSTRRPAPLRAQMVTFDSNAASLAAGYGSVKTIFDELPDGVRRTAQVLDGTRKYEDLKKAVERI